MGLIIIIVGAVTGGDTKDVFNSPMNSAVTKDKCTLFASYQEAWVAGLFVKADVWASTSSTGGNSECTTPASSTWATSMATLGGSTGAGSTAQNQYYEAYFDVATAPTTLSAAQAPYSVNSLGAMETLLKCNTMCWYYASQSNTAWYSKWLDNTNLSTYLKVYELPGATFNGSTNNCVKLPANST